MRYMRIPTIVNATQVKFSLPGCIEKVKTIVGDKLIKRGGQYYINNIIINDGDFVVKEEDNIYIVPAATAQAELVSIPFMEITNHAAVPSRFHMHKCACGKSIHFILESEINGTPYYQVRCECGMATPWMRSRIGASEIFNALVRLISMAKE